MTYYTTFINHPEINARLEGIFLTASQIPKPVWLIDARTIGTSSF